MIAKTMPEKYEERKSALVESDNWFGNKRLIKFTFGNKHIRVRDPNNSEKLTHRWTMSMNLDGSSAETSKIIKSVTYYLHRSYKVRKIKVRQAPFELSRLAWGYFDIDMDIEF